MLPDYDPATSACPYCGVASAAPIRYPVTIDLSKFEKWAADRGYTPEQIATMTTPLPSFRVIPPTGVDPAVPGEDRSVMTYTFPKLTAAQIREHGGYTPLAECVDGVDIDIIPVVPPDTPSNAQVPLIGDGPGRIRVEYERPTYDECRLRYVSVPERFVFDAFFLPSRLPGVVAVLSCDPLLPDGYELIPGAHHDPMRRCFNFLIRHPSFDVVPDGDMPPRWPDTLSWQVNYVEVKKPDSVT